jgi:hypothetical protein
MGAAARGYDMVELDVRASRDGQPVLLHGDWSRTLRLSCGVDRAAHELTLAELRALRYRATDQHVLGLDEALALCAELGLGVMLDVKVEPASAGLVEGVAASLDAHGLTRAAVTISQDPAVRAGLAGRALLRATREEAAAGDLAGRFWFGHAEELPDDAVAGHRRAGALVIPSINTFHYPPHAHLELAGDDIARLAAAGVDAFQIDDVYLDLVWTRISADSTSTEASA